MLVILYLMASESSQLLFCVRREDTQASVLFLTKLGFICTSRKILQLPGSGKIGIPLKLTSKSPLQTVTHNLDFTFELVDTTLELPFKSKCTSPYESLMSILKDCIVRENMDLSLMTEVPHKWERYEDLVLLPHNSFLSDKWSKCPNLWNLVRTALRCNRLAKNSPVSNDAYRQSRAVMLLGQSGWVKHSENGIKYCYDVTKCMFSSGNVTEKLRLSQLDCSSEVVVDLFAGIGYFTLTYLVHSRAKLVHACEWNNHAVQSLEASLVENRVRERCVIHAGDNRVVAPVGVADRVNLGLIPSSEGSWETACRCLKSSGGTLVVHGNVNSLSIEPRVLSLATSFKEKYPVREVWCMWSEMVRISFQEILKKVHTMNWVVETKHFERVKSYAPHINHLVVELFCSPFAIV